MAIRVTTFVRDIIPVIKVSGSTPEIRKYRIEDNVQFKADNYQSSWVKFIDCEFNGYCWAHSLDLKVGLYFENCDFDKSVIIHGCSAKGSDPPFGEDISIQFYNCRFKKVLIIEASDPTLDFERGISIRNCTIRGGLVINGIASSTESILIQHSTIDTRFEIKRAFAKQSVTISNCNISCQLLIDNLRTGFLSFIKNEFKRDLRIWAGEYTQGITFNDGSSLEEVAIQSAKCPKSLTIIGGVFDSMFTVDYQDLSTGLHQGVKDICLRNAHFKNGLYFKGAEDLRTPFPKLQTVDILASAQLEGDIHFTNFEIDMLRLHGFNDKANMVFHGVFVNRVMIEEFYNRAKLVLTGLRSSLENSMVLYPNGIEGKKESYLKIVNSDLGETQFFQCQLNTFASYRIHDVLFSQVIASNTTWFPKSAIGLIDEQQYQKGIFLVKRKMQSEDESRRKAALKLHFQSARETARQLKYAMEQQSDRVQSLVFRNWEMYYYRKYMAITSGKKSDRFILFLALTNNFGLSWWKATWLFLIISFVLYIPIALLTSPELEPWSISLAIPDIVNSLRVIFGHSLAYWPQLLNPVHELSTIVGLDLKLPPSIHFLDFLYRIVDSFFIFQIIVAFRKYHKF